MHQYAEVSCARQCYSVLLKTKPRLAPMVIKGINVKKGLSNVNEILDQWQPASQEFFKSLVSKMRLP